MARGSQIFSQHRPSSSTGHQGAQIISHKSGKIDDNMAKILACQVADLLQELVKAWFADERELVVSEEDSRAHFTEILADFQKLGRNGS
jgi:hypothetical protein